MILARILREFKILETSDLDLQLDESGIDSFDLISLRTAHSDRERDRSRDARPRMGKLANTVRYCETPFDIRKIRRAGQKHVPD